MEYLRLSTQTNYFYSQEFRHLQNSLAVSEEEHYERQESLRVKRRALILILHPLHVANTAQIKIQKYLNDWQWEKHKILLQISMVIPNKKVSPSYISLRGSRVSFRLFRKHSFVYYWQIRIICQWASLLFSPKVQKVNKSTGKLFTIVKDTFAKIENKKERYQYLNSPKWKSHWPNGRVIVPAGNEPAGIVLAVEGAVFSY